MGCCISTNESGEEKLASPKHQHLSERALVPELDSSCVRRANGKAPPPAPPPVEEETVKEVLSETPKPKLLPFPKIHNEKIRKPSLLDLEEESVEKKAPSNAVEDASEMSEICSVSESLSTTTMTERKDDEERSRDDGEVRQRVDRSPGKVPKKRFASGDLAQAESRRCLRNLTRS
uniref:Uncharacterized protein n=1 Tax=Nelumbo nucifera TaxID=4432 RepID=A0A822XLH0_NELNU|nr:TPA_asm: hypothetical protein HUJ06_022305 [Nelumbo nucifera]